MTRDEMTRVETYLRKTFRLDTLRLEPRPQKDDSVEVMIGDEFIGVLFKDEDEGEVAYQFQMCILDFDLDEGAA